MCVFQTMAHHPVLLVVVSVHYTGYSGECQVRIFREREREEKICTLVMKTCRTHILAVKKGGKQGAALV